MVSINLEGKGQTGAPEYECGERVWVDRFVNICMVRVVKGMGKEIKHSHHMYATKLCRCMGYQRSKRKRKHKT